MKMPANLQFRIAANDFQSVCAAWLAEHQARGGQDAFAMGAFNREIGRFIQTQVVGGKYDRFVHALALAESNYTWPDQVGKETA